MTADQLIGWITGGLGGLSVSGVILAMFLWGKLHSDHEFQREVARGDAEAEARKRLEEALMTRGTALAEANARADAAVRSAEMIAAVLSRQQDQGQIRHLRDTGSESGHAG